MSDQASRVRDQDETSSQGFLRFAQAPGSFAIHRALELPSQYPEVEKFHRQYALIADRYRKIRGHDPKSVLDLGCAVGGGLAYLGKNFSDAIIKGVTISATQARLANAMLGSEKIFPRAMAIDADFRRVDLHQKFDLICAVESAIRCNSAKEFFTAVKRHAHANTVVIIIDDFLTERAPKHPRKVATLKKYRRVPALADVPHFCEPAQMHFELLFSEDLTSFIELKKPRDRLIGLIYPFLRFINIKRWPILDKMIGSHCLQGSLRTGDIRYMSLCFGIQADS